MTGPTVHDPFAFTCGTDWIIPGVANDINGQPLNLTGATVEWFLDDLANSQRFLYLTQADGVLVDPGAAGTFTVNASGGRNVNIPPGDYKDTLIVTLANGGGVSVQWVGAITALKKPV